jgi:hypothetical protein
MKPALKHILLFWLFIIAIFYTLSFATYFSHHNHSSQKTNHTQHIIKVSAAEFTDADVADAEDCSDEESKLKCENSELVTDFYIPRNLSNQLFDSKRSRINYTPLYILTCALRI